MSTPSVSVHSAADTASNTSAEAVDSPDAARIATLDVLRGIALFGMIVVHYVGRGTTSSDPGLAGAVRQARDLLLEGRFYTMFAILFGVGFAIQLERADDRGDHLALRFSRRLAVLACIGIFTDVGFGYPVLVGYAIAAVPLLVMKRWSVRALIVMTTLCLTSGSWIPIARDGLLVRTVGVDSARAQRRAELAQTQQQRDVFNNTVKTGSYAEVVAARARQLARYGDLSGVPGTLGLFLLGVLGFRLRLFQNPDEHRRLIALLMASGVLAWALAWWVFPLAWPRPADSAPFLLRAFSGAVRNGFGVVRDKWLAFTYIGTVLLLAVRANWPRRLQVFAATGRLALTNYVLQVVVIDMTFSGYGLGLSLPLWATLTCPLLLFAAQVVFSRWWLRQHPYGPLEWLLRSATHFEIMPWRTATS